MATSTPQPAVVQKLLARAHSPDSAARIFTEKIQYRPLLLRPSSPADHGAGRPTQDPPSREAEEEKAEAETAVGRRAPAPRPVRGPRAGAKYALFEPCGLWLGYAREILGGDVYRGGPDAAQKLTSADFHGAEVEVSRSACVSRVGVRGIVIKDSRFVFEVVTKRNRVKTIPKEGTIFRVVIPVEAGDAEKIPSKAEEFVFEIHGDQFLYRAADRANKKFKSHFSKTL
ncbi:unnamed protein product [Parascedosporium putredinis]|uniref:Ribonuclease P protein subunit n=1 Tax=Parascedosporium putredinis TaxID=1442378 RepID=A0A9P1GYA2_9PEZI|nr:unnamed protein product [Parascedosporium putredinis]CAI7991540.1 unnamed protein product [Parascedosporium putredinis]